MQLYYLERKSFVEATLERPKRFVAVPLKGVLDSFIKSRREEVARIEKSKQNLLADWEKVSQERNESSLEKFSVVEGNKRILHKMSQMLEKTNNCFSVVLDVRHIIRADQYGVFSPSILSSRPEIEFRILTHASKQNFKVTKNLYKELHRLGSIKALDTNIGTSNFSKMVIRDNDEIALFISKEDVNPKKEIILCTNSKSIISAFSKVFEELWNSSKYINERITEIETGKSIPKTQLIKDPESARESYFKIL